MPNRLVAETSPYLLQHAENPVDWWPWCDDALALARREDRPILLSIGYSACHWCHVMAHESFADPEVAAVMNRLFVNIKVDREERPDLDQIYQNAHQLLARRAGGWPLTMFLAPDGVPFFGGTYFPREPRYGLPGFKDLLERVARAYVEQRATIEEQNGVLRGVLARSAAGEGKGHTGPFDDAPLGALKDHLADAFDSRHGGFGGAPKFPHPCALDFLLRRAETKGDVQARDMALTTLTRMAEGGLYDQLAGGFYRYSVDAQWAIPHFEKMLYDNGPLLALYSDAWRLTGDPLYRRVVEETAAWAMREMQRSGGGYASSLDADAEGEEGRFYVWHRDEVRALLDDPGFAVAERHYGLDRPPNFENRHWHLVVARPLSTLGLPAEEAASRLARVRAVLFAARERRARPGRDDKILTSWNALMIAGMARAARAFGRREWLESARRALAFVRRQLWHNGRLMATSDGGAGRLNAYLDDHALLIAALLELAQTDFRAEDLAFATELADAMLESFEDSAGGFFFTRHDHEALIQRPKPFHDGAMPGGNGVAARVLLRLGHITGDHRYLEAAERCVHAFYAALRRDPAACASLAIALDEVLKPPVVAVLRGPGAAVRDWQRALAGGYRPASLVLALQERAESLPPALDKPLAGHVRAWVCRGAECLAPIDELGTLEAALRR